MRTPGRGHGLRPLGVAFRRAQARRRRRGHRAADRDRHDPLHPLHALRPLHERDRRHLGARRHRSRRKYRDRHLHRQVDRVGTRRQHHRCLPGRCTHQQAVPLQGARLGTDRARIDRLPRRARFEPVPAHASRRSVAHRAEGQRGDQRELVVGPRPLQSSRLGRIGSRDATDDPWRRRRTEGRVVGGSDPLRRRWPQARRANAWRRSDCRAGGADDVERGGLPARGTAARSRQSQHRPSPARR